jgi:hypothetical protein
VAGSRKNDLQEYKEVRMAGEIFRKQTEAEKDLTPVTSDGNTTGFIDLMSDPKSSHAKFMEEMGKKILEATKKGIPFADMAAKRDFNEHYEQQAREHNRKYGKVIPSEIKPIKMDLNKYCDLKNFDVLKEDEVYDDNLSRRHNVAVYVKKTDYQFKGNREIYQIMEMPEDAVARAKKLAK